MLLLTDLLSFVDYVWFLLVCWYGAYVVCFLFDSDFVCSLVVGCVGCIYFACI